MGHGVWGDGVMGMRKYGGRGECGEMGDKGDKGDKGE